MKRIHEPSGSSRNVVSHTILLGLTPSYGMLLKSCLAKFPGVRSCLMAATAFCAAAVTCSLVISWARAAGAARSPTMQPMPTHAASNCL